MSKKVSLNGATTAKEGTNVEEEDEELLTSCGIGSWRPQSLQCFANPFVFMINISILGILLGQSGSVYYSQSSTIEKRFGFDSKLTGLIMIMDNFAEIGVRALIFNFSCFCFYLKKLGCDF